MAISGHLPSAKWTDGHDDGKLYMCERKLSDLSGHLSGLSVQKTSCVGYASLVGLRFP